MNTRTCEEKHEKTDETSQKSIGNPLDVVKSLRIVKIENR